ncbi:hypothetical protein C8R44DRAFT_875817 [Mycena epipterygia]|nr:hypothetical protein C8R44DRAFT_875817 [Mycena epipterygia]
MWPRLRHVRGGVVVEGESNWGRDDHAAEVDEREEVFQGLHICTPISEKINVDRKTVRFNFDGANIEQEGATAEDLEMEDGDVIDGQIWQEGGNRYS